MGQFTFYIVNFLNFPLSESWFCTLCRGEICVCWFDHQRLWVLLMDPIVACKTSYWQDDDIQNGHEILRLLQRFNTMTPNHTNWPWHRFSQFLLPTCKMPGYLYNSLKYGAYMCQWTRSSLFRIIACHLHYPNHGGLLLIRIKIQ